MVAQLPHPITQKAETGGTQILGQLGLLGETILRILVLTLPLLPTACQKLVIYNRSSVILGF